MRLLVINGPNINMLGIREPDIYGKVGYTDLLEMMSAHAKLAGVDAEFFQSNHEGDIVDRIQRAYGRFDGIIINPEAYTHTSVALHDCIRSLKCPVVEVHISNVHQREAFRHQSMISAACKGVICGFGLKSYSLAIAALTK